MRICFVCHEYPPGPHGGIGTLVQILARSLALAGHQVRVVGVYAPTYPAPGYEVDRGVRVWRLRRPQVRGGWVLSRLELFRRLSDWCRQGEIDLIEIPDWEGWAAGWPRLPVPVVARLSGSGSFFAGELGRRAGRLGYSLERRSLRRAHFWCAESRYVGEQTQRLFGLQPAYQTTLYNPVEFPEELPAVPRSKNQVVFAGTLTPKKGVISLIKSWPLVKARLPEAELHVWGKEGRTDGGEPMSAHLRSRLTGPAAESVHFHGHVALEELFKALPSARVVVLPSYAEGFALMPLHAMAHACPTIYTRRGSGPEVIDHGHNGLLVDPDRPEEIAAAICHVLEDDEVARRLGEAGREQVRRRFSLQTIVAENEEFYRHCLDIFRAARLGSRRAGLSWRGRPAPGN